MARVLSGMNVKKLEEKTMLVSLCGDYKSGKTVSACTFPKPLLFCDWDGGFTSVLNTRRPSGELIVPDTQNITLIPFHKENVSPLSFSTQDKVAPSHVRESPLLIKRHNEIISSLAKDGTYNGSGPFKTLVIDSMTNFFRVWKECILSMNSIGHLRIQDYGTLEAVLFGQFIPSLKSLIASGKVEHVVLVTHTDIEKDDLTGQLYEFPVGPSRNMGRSMGLHIDEIWRQRQEGGKYVWRTRKVGMFQAGSRLNLPEVIEPAEYSALEAALLRVKGGESMK